MPPRQQEIVARAVCFGKWDVHSVTAVNQHRRFSFHFNPMHHDEIKAQAAGQRAREMAAKDGGGGMFAQLKRDAADAATPAPRTTTSKRVTPPKNAPTSGRGPTKARPASTGKAGRRKR